MSLRTTAIVYAAPTFFFSASPYHVKAISDKVSLVFIACPGAPRNGWIRRLSIYRYSIKLIFSFLNSIFFEITAEWYYIY